MVSTEPRTPLTGWQVEVARRFFAEPEGADYVLAGAGGLAAQGLITRATKDLDLFTRGLDTTVAGARAALERLADRCRWVVTVERATDTFCRLTITRTADGQTVDVDLAADVSPRGEPTMTFAGPVYAAAEAGSRKLLALFDRAAARDFVDVYTLARQGLLEQMIAQAPDIDLGFDVRHLAAALAQLPAIADQDLDMPEPDKPAMRDFYAQWRQIAATGSTAIPKLPTPAAPPRLSRWQPGAGQPAPDQPLPPDAPRLGE